MLHGGLLRPSPDEGAQADLVVAAEVAGGVSDAVLRRNELTVNRRQEELFQLTQKINPRGEILVK